MTMYDAWGVWAVTRPKKVDRAQIVARFKKFLRTIRYEPVCLAEICAAIGVPERTLRLCCQERFGLGPIHYLRLRRMHLARRSLLNAGSFRTVTQIASDYGFSELGRFSVETGCCLAKRLPKR
jgi:AraC-like DNA-binding protein